MGLYLQSMSKITKPCDVCGKPVTRYRSEFRKVVCCSWGCAKTYNSKRFSILNVELNPTRMTPETRQKLRGKHLGKGEGRGYEKTFSRHTHRIIAEDKLGRPLRKGEVVHHIDENKRNNHPDNIHIFSSQSEHVKQHWEIKKQKECCTNPTIINGSQNNTLSITVSVAFSLRWGWVFSRWLEKVTGNK